MNPVYIGYIDIYRVYGYINISCSVYHLPAGQARHTWCIDVERPIAVVMIPQRKQPKATM